MAAPQDRKEGPPTGDRVESRPPLRIGRPESQDIPPAPITALPCNGDGRIGVFETGGAVIGAPFASAAQRRSARRS